jgi:predicted transcriptional regulator
MSMAFTLRTDAELDAALAELSAAQGLSKQEIARKAILELHARTQHTARVADASSASRARWGDVLERLGSV